MDHRIDEFLQRLKVACVVLLALLPTVAAAQARPSANGIKVGEGRLHPFLDLEMRVDSAALFKDGNYLAEGILHVRPGLRLDVPGNKATLGLKGNADFLLYTGLLGTGGPSRVEGDLDLNLGFNPNGPVGFEITDHFARSDRTSATALGVGTISLYNQLGAALPIRPGGGALEIVPSAKWTVEFFDKIIEDNTTPCPGGMGVCNPASFNYSKFTGGLTTRYKFLPKTAVVLDASFDAPTYFSGGAGAMLLRTQAGLSGLVTPKLAMLLKAGYARDFSGGAQGRSNTAVGHLELAYLPSETASVRVGYLRTIEPIANYRTYRDDRGYVEGRTLLGGKLTLRGYAAYDALTYVGGSAATPRRDAMISFTAGPEYQFNRYFIGAVGYGLSNRASTDSGAGLNFMRHEGYLRLTLTY